MSLKAGDIGRLVDRDSLVGRLQELVRTPSENPPGDEKAAAELVAGWCQDLGLEVALHEADPGRPSVVARWPAADGPTLAYCSHIDVVPAGERDLWSADPYGGSISDGRLHGRGSSDAKGPVAAALEAVAILRRAGAELAGTLELEFVCDEEAMGFKGAGHLVSTGIVAPDMAIVGEPTSLRVVRAQRGAYWYQIRTRGVAAHGSAPERGRSAILDMAEIVSHLEETLPDVDHPVLGRPTVNVGLIHGGEKINIVPASCVVEVDRRSIPEETEESITASIQAAIDRAKERRPQIDAEIELSFIAHPFEIDEHARVVEEVHGAMSDALERPAELIGFRGTSDARFLSAAGADVVVCGPGDITLAHTARESIELAELERGAVGYALAFMRLLGTA